MKKNQIADTIEHLDSGHGYMLASTYLQCVPPFGPNNKPGGNGSKDDHELYVVDGTQWLDGESREDAHFGIGAGYANGVKDAELDRAHAMCRPARLPGRPVSLSIR